MDHKMLTAVQHLRVLWTVVANLNHSTKISITVIYEPQYKNNLNHNTIYEPQYQNSADDFLTEVYFCTAVVIFHDLIMQIIFWLRSIFLLRL